MLWQHKPSVGDLSFPSSCHDSQAQGRSSAIARHKAGQRCQKSEHKTRKTTQTGFRAAAPKRYVGKPAARTPSPAELRRLRPAPDDDEFGPLPTTEKLASDWLHEHRVFKPPGKCNCCSSKKWSNIIWPTGHDSAHYRCSTCGTCALDHFEVFIYMFFSILFANP